jgi:hypothetical protein
MKNQQPNDRIIKLLNEKEVNPDDLNFFQLMAIKRARATIRETHNDDYEP